MLIEVSVRLFSPEVAIITLTGPLTLGTSLKTAEAQIDDVINGGAHRLVLEMSAVPYVDSAGLGTLMLISGKAQDRGGSLRLVGTAARVLSLLRLTRTDALLPVDASVEASLAAF